VAGVGAGAGAASGSGVRGQVVEWLLRRNNSISPAQMGVMYASLCVVSLAIGLAFWAHGATMVLPFAGIELLLVGTAFLIHARHATDGERILLADRALVVELEQAGRRSRQEFPRDWVRVEPQAGDGSLIELSAQGRRVNIGRYVRPELRPELAREIRQALRGESAEPEVAASPAPASTASTAVQ
jgi:uncharacterized membrane protein